MTVVFSSIITPIGLGEPQVTPSPMGSQMQLHSGGVWQAGTYLLDFVLWGSLRLSLSLLVVLEPWDRSWESGPSGATAPWSHWTV